MAAEHFEICTICCKESVECKIHLGFLGLTKTLCLNCFYTYRILVNSKSEHESLFKMEFIDQPKKEI